MEEAKKILGADFITVSFNDGTQELWNKTRKDLIPVDEHDFTQMEITGTYEEFKAKLAM